jgi:hypothetical protein
MKYRNHLKTLIALLGLNLLAGAATAQLGEWGDAPEGAIAYPSLGVIGAFPTCMNAGPGGWIWHNPLCWAYFGATCDFETEGNASLCASFPPYDQDECFADNDAGLMFPGAWTIAGGVVVPCQDGGGPIGPSCTNAVWGINLDILITNTMPVDGYVNVLFDWNQDGVWGGSSPCTGANAPEHVLVDLVVPVGFAGPLSLLAPPSFLIGPRQGYVWSRFTVTNVPIGNNWDGTGNFEDGESEDYLLYVDGLVPADETSWSTLKANYR